MPNIAFQNDRQIHPYVLLARRSIEITAQNMDPFRFIDTSVFWDMPEMNISKACFVSIKKNNGELRGCIGTITPSCKFIWTEIIKNAHAAACMDPRFPPLRPEETKHCRVSLDVLEKPEPVNDISSLDPFSLGIIVEKGGKRGVLLPDLEGVDTVQHQLSLAMRKAGIFSSEGMTISKFRITRFQE